MFKLHFIIFIYFRYSFNFVLVYQLKAAIELSSLFYRLLLYRIVLRSLYCLNSTCLAKTLTDFHDFFFSYNGMIKSLGLFPLFRFIFPFHIYMISSKKRNASFMSGSNNSFVLWTSNHVTVFLKSQTSSTHFVIKLENGNILFGLHSIISFKNLIFEKKGDVLKKKKKSRFFFSFFRFLDNLKNINENHFILNTWIRRVSSYLSFNLNLSTHWIEKKSCNW